MKILYVDGLDDYAATAFKEYYWDKKIQNKE